MARPRPARTGNGRLGPRDPDWYKDAIVYELHVRAFQDSNADGIGDFQGLIARLDYLQYLGVTAVWLLPFYPSPLRDDGYDIADYTDVHPAYGTLDDFRRFLDEAHRRGLHVITELVVNHTSDQHPWFQRARTAPAGSPERDFYVWSDSPARYEGARVIFQDFEQSNWTWDPAAQAYYWHRFYAHQPDLNFDNPAVFEAVRDVIDFWFGLGVDGMRLDAVPYLVERDGTHSENLRQTHDVLRRLRRHVDERFANRMFLAEANQWPEDAAAYFGDGDESHMVFHFPLMPRLFLAIRQEDRLPVVDILAQTPAAPPGCQWALFLRNHDELTLEMVTEEEREYMYDVYATDPQARINLGIRRRLAPLVGNDRRRIELMNMLLLSLPGSPILYYGDEIGMGDNIYLGDRNGVRTPMQWSADRNAGFSNAGAQQLFLPLIVDEQYHYQAVHVEQQMKGASSLLSWMARVIGIRKRYQAFGRGSMEIVDAPNPRVLAYVREWEQQRILVVANLSRFAQHVRLDLARCAGYVPVELFGRTAFPPIEADPYAVSLGPHACHWFELRPARERPSPKMLPRLRFERQWDEVLDERGRVELEAALPRYIEACTAWAGTRVVLAVEIEDVLPIRSDGRSFALLVLRASFASGEPQRYLLPIGCRRSRRHAGDTGLIATLARGSEGESVELVLYDASEDDVLATALADLVRNGMPIRGRRGSLEPARSANARFPRGARAHTSHLRRGRRGPNAVVTVGDGLVLKLFRQLDAGANPDIEVCEFLNDAGFERSPRVCGTLHYRVDDVRRPHVLALGMLQRYLPNDGEAWPRAVLAAERFFEAALHRRRACAVVTSLVPAINGGTMDRSPDDVIGDYAEVVRLIAARTAELHRALASTTNPAFVPEPLGPLTRRSAYQRMRTLAASVTQSLRFRREQLPRSLCAAADGVVGRLDTAIEIYRRIPARGVHGCNIRCHGNFHLGQLLHVGDDLAIIDFEGEPGRPLYERRLKRSPLQDVAAMVRSLHNAAHAAYTRTAARGAGRRMEGWLRCWQQRAATVFVDAYVGAMQGTSLLPPRPDDFAVVLHAHLLDRAYYELGHELDRGDGHLRAALLDIPLLLS